MKHEYKFKHKFEIGEIVYLEPKDVIGTHLEVRKVDKIRCETSKRGEIVTYTLDNGNMYPEIDLMNTKDLDRKHKGTCTMQKPKKDLHKF